MKLLAFLVAIILPIFSIAGIISNIEVAFDNALAKGKGGKSKSISILYQRSGFLFKKGSKHPRCRNVSVGPVKAKAGKQSLSGVTWNYLVCK